MYLFDTQVCEMLHCVLFPFAQEHCIPSIFTSDFFTPSQSCLLFQSASYDAIIKKRHPLFSAASQWIIEVPHNGEGLFLTPQAQTDTNSRHIEECLCLLCFCTYPINSLTSPTRSGRTTFRHNINHSVFTSHHYHNSFDVHLGGSSYHYVEDCHKETSW